MNFKTSKQKPFEKYLLKNLISLMSANENNQIRDVFREPFWETLNE